MSMPFSAATSRMVWSSVARHVGAVDDQRTDAHGPSVPIMVHTPAGQVRSSMWARYSSRK